MPTPTSFPQNRIKNENCGYETNWSTNNPSPKTYFSTISDYEGGRMPVNVSHRRGPDGEYHEGGPWQMNRYRSSRHWKDVKVFRYLNNTPAFIGGFSCTHIAPTQFYSTEDGQWNDAFEQGAKALARLRPDTPDFSAASSLYELRESVLPLKEATRDLLDKIARNKKRNRWRENAGSEFALALQFGWLPLLNDIRSFGASFQGRKKRFNQLLRDEGRPVRRRVNLENGPKVIGKRPDGSLVRQHKDFDTDSVSVITHNVPYNPNMYPTLVSQCYPTSGTCTTTTRTRVRSRTWAVGKSRYVLPPGPRDDRWRRNIMMRIMGVNATPSTVYNIMPWSWLIDYFTGLGSFLEAASAGVADSWYFEYAYLMRERTMRVDREATSRLLLNASGSRIELVPCWSTTEYSYKTRVPASTFGWGINNDALTPRQSVILATLGKTRA